MDFAKIRAEARTRDDADPLARLRSEFHIPTKRQIASTVLQLPTPSESASPDEQAIYLVGNSLGLQPTRTAVRIRTHLDTWAIKAVAGHFTKLPDSPLAPWLDVDERAAEMMAPVVGAQQSEVAVMQTLSANLHLLMCAFYKPDAKGKHKIILEEKAFPSDHFVAETQIRHHNLPPSSLILLRPDTQTSLISTSVILDTITAHAAETAVLLLPGIQYYTGQLLDIPTITAHAHKHDVLVIWDLAHAAGNAPLKLHDWGVDAAAWCGYKYLNGGPGCIGSLFVHEKHHGGARNMLGGWWGSDKAGRFVMDNNFVPSMGAAAFQLSNPSIICTTSLLASLEVFAEAGGVEALRKKSVPLTTFLYEQLEQLQAAFDTPPFKIVTPKDPSQRGAQLSILLNDGMLDAVLHSLEEKGVYVDERRPSIIRVAPTPLYNTYLDCVGFVEAFHHALRGIEKI